MGSAWLLPLRSKVQPEHLSCNKREMKLQPVCVSMCALDCCHAFFFFLFCPFSLTLHLALPEWSQALSHSTVQFIAIQLDSNGPWWRPGVCNGGSFSCHYRLPGSLWISYNNVLNRWSTVDIATGSTKSGRKPLMWQLDAETEMDAICCRGLSQVHRNLYGV